MAQTSVEWLFYTMQKTPMNEWYKVLEQAKEMHKEDCLNFSIEWENRRDDDDIKSKENLYDEIYNK